MVDKRMGIERILREYFEEIGEKVEKVVFLPWYEDVKAKYIKKYEGFVRVVGNTYAGVVVVEGVQIPFVADVWLNGKVNIFLYPMTKDFYLARLVGDLDGRKEELFK
ncbi:hypothetical protein [Sulfolobus spindle-shaped virus]|nr:hypothetical protein [Sulfolobus spindle-shaped virus]AZG03178.1 hypothetical protein [Sulfolobus spindle-shaped virus]AZG03356.1 hypothetical protein [Sulfolobus spindle-shaped virus]